MQSFAAGHTRSQIQASLVSGNLQQHFGLLPIEHMLVMPRTTCLFYGNVDSQIANRKDSQQPGVIAARVISDLELCLKSCSLAYPLFYAFSLLLWLPKGILAVKDDSLILLVEPRNEQSDLRS